MKNLLLLLICFSMYCATQAQHYRLINPKDDYVFSDTTISFSWNIVDSALNYDILVATDAGFSSTVFSQNSLSTTYIQDNLASGFTYYWKVRANTAQGPQAWSYYRKFSIFSPDQYSGLVMWFDAAANVTASSGNVSQWSDLSPLNLVATQATTANMPTLIDSVSQLNNKPVVRFSGSTTAPNSLNFSTLNLTFFTAVMVRSYAHNTNYVQYVIGGTQNGLCSEANYYNGGYGVYSNLQGTDALYSSSPSDLVPGYSVYTTQADHVYRNGVAPVLSSTGVIAGLALSALGTRPDLAILAYQGDLAEVMMYDHSLDSNSRQLAEGYLRYKYSKHVDLGADTIFAAFCVNVNLSANPGFTSYLWSTGETASSINATSLGTYSVIATDVFGYLSYDTIEVRPQGAFNQLRDSIILCKGDSVVWNTGYPAGGFTFTWSNGATTPSIVINTPGAYTVDIKDVFNCHLYSDTVHVMVDSFPDYTLGPDTSFCSGNSLNFAYPNPLDTLLWSTGDTAKILPVTVAGSYSVRAVNANGCVVKDTIQVNIRGVAPVVNFMNPVLCINDTVQFTDSTIPPFGNTIVWRTWDFGGGDTTNLQNPTHVFSPDGHYTVSLTAYTDSGCSNSVTKNLTVYLKPQAYFQSTISCALSQTQFTDLSATTPPATLNQWQWSFAGIASSSLQNPMYVFPAIGVYPVSLTATNSDGCTNTFSQIIEVFSPLAADFNFSHVCFGDSTAFIDLTPSFSVVSWRWTFDDGSYAGITQNPKHEYIAPGNYTVNLSIENAIGCKDSVSKNISIVQYPTAEFSGLYPCLNSYYTPLDSSISPSEPISTWKWSFDGNIINGQWPQYLYTDSNLHTVKLTVTTQSGCADSVSKIVQAHPNPDAAFLFEPLYGEAPVDITFSNQSRNDGTYLWNFGDGSPLSNEVNPVHTYLQNDTLLITLYAISSFGCEDSLSKIFIIAHTDLDLSVDEVISNETPLNDGTTLIQVTAKISNLATRLITEAQLYATIGSGGVVSEEWTGVLQSGQIMDYIFNAQFVVSSSNANSYICVEAKSVNNGQSELRIDNNSQCASLNQTLQLIGPSPNPVHYSAYLGLILPAAGTVTVDVANELGQRSLPQLQVDLPQGRSDYNLPVQQLQAGEYFMRIKYNDDLIVRKLVVY